MYNKPMESNVWMTVFDPKTENNIFTVHCFPVFGPKRPLIKKTSPELITLALTSTLYGQISRVISDRMCQLKSIKQLY